MPKLCRKLLCCLAALLPLAFAQSFDSTFEQIKKTATKDQLYSLMWDLPKGGDLHNHFGLSNWAEQWESVALDPKRNHGNEFFTRVKLNNCPDSTEPLLRFYHIQRSTYKKLSVCRNSE